MREFIIVSNIAAVIALIALLVWRAYVTTKHKNSVEVKGVLTRARAFSTITLWGGFLGWNTISILVDANTMFTLSNVRSIIIALFGLQCAMELLAGIYCIKKI